MASRRLLMYASLSRMRSLSKGPRQSRHLTLGMLPQQSGAGLTRKEPSAWCTQTLDCGRYSFLADAARITGLETDVLGSERYKSRLLAVGIVLVSAGRRSRRAVDTGTLAPAEPAVSFLRLAVADIQGLDGRGVGVAVHFVGADEVD